LASPNTVADRTDCHVVHFATRTLPPATAVVTAHGELDASNAQEFIAYALKHTAGMKRLVVDLTGVSFFGTAAFSAVHTLNVRCAGDGITWALVPSTAVTRLLRICDPDSALMIYDSIDVALSAVTGEHRPLLQLISQPR
jgi:anti-anti-sigma factor